MPLPPPFRNTMLTIEVQISPFGDLELYKNGDFRLQTCPFNAGGCNENCALFMLTTTELQLCIKTYAVRTVTRRKNESDIHPG